MFKSISNDSEMIALSEAIKMYIKHCEEELEREPRAPFYAHKDALVNVSRRLYDRKYQTSGNNFFD